MLLLFMMMKMKMKLILMKINILNIKYIINHLYNKIFINILFKILNYLNEIYL